MPLKPPQGLRSTHHSLVEIGSEILKITIDTITINIVGIIG